MASIKPTTVPTKRLAASINAASMTFVLNNIEGWDGADLTAADLGTKAYGVFRNTTNTVMEIFEYDPSTIASASITILRRGLKFTGDLTTEVTANKLTWIRNETLCELGSDVPQLLAHYMDDLADQSISGIKTFDATTPPRASGTITYGAGSEKFLVTKEELDNTSFAGVADASTTQKGIAEEATQAEVSAATAAGSAARLFVNPSTLKTSVYGDTVFNRKLGYAVDAVGSDAYAITLSPVPTAYATGMLIQFKAGTTNTGACTIDVNALGAKNIKVAGSDPVNGAIVSGKIYNLVYDGTNFEILNPDGAIPSGAVMMWVNASAPGGYLLCDGASLLRSDYATLFATIGTVFGSADGTHFNVPDFRGRSPIGVGTGTGGGAAGTGAPTGGSALTAVALATWKGEETHALIEAELASHHHGITLYTTTTGSATGCYGLTGSNVAAFGSTTTGDTGSGTAHNTIQPVLGINFIIKT